MSVSRLLSDCIASEERMRLSSIEIEGFRGFAQRVSLDLDADTVIIVGANGQGKTSLFDAVLWALSGSVPRFGNDDSRLISLYSISGTSRVCLELQSAAEGKCVIDRSSDGKRQRLSVDINGITYTDTEANYFIFKQLWPEALATESSNTALTTAITRSVYLQQDLVRQFIETDDEQMRFKAASELVGAGRVTELQLELDRARTAWTRATNVRERDAEESRNRLMLLESRLARLADVTPQESVDIEEAWSNWWERATVLGVSLDTPKAASPGAPTSIDVAIKQLRELRRSNDRQHALCKELVAEIESSALTAEPPDIDSLRKASELTEERLQQLREDLAQAERQAARARRAQVEHRETREELRALAQLALRHLAGDCPVCGQKHDEANTRRRLDELCAMPAEEVTVIDHRATELAADLERQEEICLGAKARLRDAEKADREYRDWVRRRDSRLKEMGFHLTQESEIVERLDMLDTELEDKKGRMAGLEEEGEQLALSLAQVAEMARRTELEQEVTRMRKEVEQHEKDVLDRQKTGSLAAQILEGLRDAAYFVVQEQLKRIEPVLRGIYAMIDPHPAFRDVRFVIRFAGGRGRLGTTVDDRHEKLSSESPWAVLSSSQMNALAVAIFLSFNLGVPKLPVEAAMLDDPLQSLDDVNLLGLMDLLRRTKDRRQLIISTHDSRFGRLMQRKLRPINEHQRTITIEFTGWSRHGPTIRSEDVVPDLEPLRVAAR